MLVTEFFVGNDIFKWFSCHHSVACTQVADGRDSLQVWMVAADILSKQSWTAGREWPSSLGAGWGANNPPPYKTNLLQNVLLSFGPG